MLVHHVHEDLWKKKGVVRFCYENKEEKKILGKVR